MRGHRRFREASDDQKKRTSYLFDTFIRPTGFKRGEDPKYEKPPAEYCFHHVGTLGKVYKYEDLNEKQKEMMRKYAVWIINPTVPIEEIKHLFSLAKENIIEVANENLPSPTLPVWKILRILESYDVQRKQKPNGPFEKRYFW